MATILKVHGTFASGPEEGDKWWQRGSECCKHVGELVEAEDGQLKIEQVVWDGLNSELSRQAAATKLLDRMGELEKAGEQYCVVGHSHGGSVISAALLRATHQRKPLDKLARWVTIGTPFIEAKRSRLLFARLGPVGKTMLLSVVALVVGGFLYAAKMSGVWSKQLGQANAPEGVTFENLSFAIGLLVFFGYPILWFLARHRLYWHNKTLQAKAKEAFAGKWLSLRHEDDEAVQGLGAFHSVKHPIFPRDFAVAPLSRSAIVVVPAIILVLFIWVGDRASRLEIEVLERINRTAAEATSGANSAAQKNVVAEKAAASAAKAASEGKASTAEAKATAPPSEQPASATKPETPATSAAAKDDAKSGSIDWGEFFAILIGVGSAIGFPVAIYYLVHWIAKPTSRALSYGLNRMTWSQLRRSSLGSDVDGEVGRHARDHPMWIDQPTRPLPRALSSEIAAVSDAAAAQSISKFREALSELAFYRLEDGGRDALNAFLTGDELIHTTYFKVPRFRKLLAYSIAQSPGFRPSAALRNDPDFPVIEQWYRELTAQTTPPPLPQVAQPAVVLQPN